MGGKAHTVTRKLHDQYGPLVRIAPDEVSVSDPEAVKIIYSVKSPFLKSDFYDGFGAAISPNGKLFTQRDEKIHALRRKIVNPMYTMSSVLEQECCVDTCLALFDQSMMRFCRLGRSNRFREMALDVIGELFFGRHFGFMEKEHDYGGWMSTLEVMFPILAITYVLPKYLRGVLNLVALSSSNVRKGIPAMGHLMKASVTCVSERKDQLERGESVRQDMLQNAFDLYTAARDDEKKAPGQKMLIEDCHSEALAAIGAGNETTAIALRAIIYNLLTHPSVLETLLNEIDTADKEGRLSRPYARYTETLKLPYLVACCKEGMRVHPSIALNFPREIPKGGVNIAGKHLAAGYKVGMSPAVVQFSPEVFGEKVDEFRPERWLEGDATKMDRYMMVFGQGKRTCIGINIALVEMYKLVPQFLRDFRVELAHPGKELRTHNVWFHRQYGFEVKVTKRHG